MVNNKLDRTEWIDDLRILAHLLDSISHGSQVNHSWNPSEILQNDSRRFKGNLDLFVLSLVPIEDILGCLLIEHKLIIISKSIFQ
jgi:hypothetical protein